MCPYLNISKLQKIYIPMKCFCDINLHKIGSHLDWYGYYGLAFSKEWGMKKGIQPIHYINPHSSLSNDFTEVFNSALNSDNEDELNNLLKSYMLHELMYYKPYQGDSKNRTTGKYGPKCFTEECEWRYIPNLDSTGFQPLYYDSLITNSSTMLDISNALMKVPTASLNYEYNDLKHIIIKDTDDFALLVNEIVKLDITQNQKYELISKIIIWDKYKGDF